MWRQRAQIFKGWRTWYLTKQTECLTWDLVCVLTMIGESLYRELFCKQNYLNDMWSSSLFFDQSPKWDLLQVMFVLTDKVSVWLNSKLMSRKDFLSNNLGTRGFFSRAARSFVGHRPTRLRPKPREETSGHFIALERRPLFGWREGTTGDTSTFAG